MAKFTPGPTVAAVSGSIGGTTYSHNNAGAYIRNRSIPVNPNTPIQTVRRDTLTFLAQNWRNLTQAERDGWIQAAQSVTLVDALGQQFNPTGNQLYISNNFNRDLVGNAFVDTAPTIDSAPGFGPAVLTIDTGGPPPSLTVNGAPNGETATNHFMVYATAPVSQGIQFFKAGDYRFVQAFAGNAALPLDFTTAYQAIYGTGWITAIGNKISVRVWGQSDNGFRGTFERADAVIA